MNSLLTYINSAAIFYILGIETTKTQLPDVATTTALSELPQQMSSTNFLNAASIFAGSLKMLSSIGVIKLGCFCVIPATITGVLCAPVVLSWLNLPKKINSYFSSQANLVETIKLNDVAISQMIEKLTSNYLIMSRNIDNQNLVLDNLISTAETIDTSLQQIKTDLDNQKLLNNLAHQNISALCRGLQIITDRIDSL